MPGWGRALSSREIDALVVFVRSFAPAPPEGLPPDLRDLLARARFVPSEAMPPAPPLDLHRTDGTRQTLADLRGRVVLVDFWGTTCAPCLKELPELERLADTFRDRGLAVLPVCIDETDPRVVEEVARRRVEHLPVALDPGGLARLRFDVQSLPTAVLIDRSGRVLGRAEGAQDWSTPEVRALVKRCLDRPPSAPPSLSLHLP
jgi:thiol-disulfide isomerase/thioredoxin